MGVRARLLVRFVTALCCSCVVASCTGREALDPSSSPVSPGSSTPAPTQVPVDVIPRYTATEMHVMRVMRRAGAGNVGQAEAAHGDSDADISGLWRGVEILVVGYPSDVREPQGETLDTRMIGGERVIEARAGARRMLVLECRGFTYEVSKLPGDRWDTGVMMSFAEALIESTDC